MSTPAVSPTQLRARFALALSELYAAEVPAYQTLVDVSRRVNEQVLARDGDDAERLGSIDRVTAERHGAIRVGTPEEMQQVARVFGAAGMHPTGYYDLRDAQPKPIPVVSTAFRPLDRDELAANPFRVFTSMLVVDDRRFFDADTERELRRFLDARTLFSDELLTLSDRAMSDGGLSSTDADAWLKLTADSFALSTEPVDRAWYARLEAISSVAADIGGVSSTHINHLTPRVLDIDELYRQMSAEGITMIDAIQGPPRWDGPDVLLRQTSFRALAEPRRMVDADGTIGTGELRVRFGEVEARGVALTPAGRDLYDSLVAEVERRLADRPGATRQDVAAEVWRQGLPATEAELARRDLAYFTFEVADVLPSGQPPSDLGGLLDGGWVTAEPIVYEDFLPRSAAGIFASNLTTDGSSDDSQDASERGEEWLAEVIGRPLNDPHVGYAAQRSTSLATCAARLGLSTITLP